MKSSAAATGIHSAAAILIAVALLSPTRAWTQASAIPSAAPAGNQPGISTDQRGRQLLDQMVTALGGDLWRNRQYLETQGHTAAFFHGQPNGTVIEYRELRRFPASGQPEADRIGFLTERGMILPGKKIDVVQIWTAGQGYEITYKGQTTLPKEQVEDFYRRRHHSLEEVVNTWLKAPGVMVVSEGTTMVERRIADKVTILAVDNDAVTIELDATTHLPLRRTYQTRNEKFKDIDEDAEEYDDYHTIQGLPTPFTISRYHNGDLANQKFIIKAEYNTHPQPATFDVDKPLKK